MPYLIVTTQVRMESGPTNIGDENICPSIVEHLNARLVKELGDIVSHYVVNKPPRVVLNELETIGYKVIGSSGVGQTCVWTLHKTENEKA